MFQSIDFQLFELNKIEKKLEKSHLIQLIFSLGPTEVREARKFLASPFFNQRADVVQLFDFLCQRQDVEKTAAKRHLFGPDSQADDQELRLRMTYLHRLLEQFLAVKEFLADEHGQRVRTVSSYRKRGLAAHFDRAKSQTERKMAAQPVRDARFFARQQRLEWEAHQQISTIKPTDTARLRASDAAADVAYFSQKLRHICLLAAHGSVYEKENQQPWTVEVLRMAAESPVLKNEPCIAAYLHGYWMLTEPGRKEHFDDFRRVLWDSPDAFSAEETRALYLLAVNFCIRQINAGRPDFNSEALGLYKKGLETGILFENGLLTRFTFSNIVAAGLHSGELDWVRSFIHDNKNRLEKSHRESGFSFNLARLEHAAGNHDAVMALLQKSNYRDPLHNLAAKTILLKTFFDLGEHDSLASHIDAMRNYIHRKGSLGYHRTSYLNLLKYVDKLLKINPLERGELSKLAAGIEKEEALPEKKWLLERAERLGG